MTGAARHVSEPEVPSVSFGVIGCGSIGVGIHLPVLARTPGVRVTAVSDPSSQALRRALEIAPVEAVAHADELLARSDIEAVVVSAPTERHAELALAVAAAGKHLYLEKPVAAHVEDGERILAAVENAGTTAAVGFNYRFHPGVVRARELLASGAVGRVRSVATRLWEPAPSWRIAEWRRRRSSGGGALLDLGSHHVDLLRWLLSDEIVEASAVIRSRKTEDDVVEARFSTAGGIVCESSFSYRSGRADELVISGDEAELRLDRYAGSVELRSPAARPDRRGPAFAVVAWARALRPALDPSYELALRAFVERLRGHSCELPTIADGVRCLAAIVEAERSSSRAS